MDCLFQNKFYRVLLTRPDRDCVGTIVNFGPLHPVSPDTGFGEYPKVDDENFITRSGFNGVFVDAARNDWYQHPSITAALEKTLHQICELGPVITYGTSMGGFGAVAHAKALSAKLFLSVSPQVSIHNEFMKKIEDPNWRPYRKYFANEWIRDGACSDQKGVVAFDPMNREDRIHAQAILRATRSFGLECHGTDHFAAVRLLRDVGFGPLVAKLFAAHDSEPALASFIEETQATIDSGIAVTFMKGNDDERARVLCEIGPKRLLQQITIQSIVADLRRVPTSARAELLVSLLPHLVSETHVQYAIRALTACDMEHLLVRTNPTEAV